MIKLYLFHCLDGAHPEYEFVRRLDVINFLGNMDKMVTRIFKLAVLAIIEMVLLAPLHNKWGQNQNRWKKRHKVGSISEIRYTEVRWKKSICVSHFSFSSCPPNLQFSTSTSEICTRK